MKDFNITIGDVVASTDMIEEDVIRLGMELEPKEQDGKENTKEEQPFVK